MFVAMLAMGKSPAQISAAWDDLVVAHPTTTDTTGARTITFNGGARTVTTDGEQVGKLALQYSVNGGAFTAYTGGFSFTSGDTLNWRGSFTDNVSKNCNVYVNGVLLDTFAAEATGFP